MTGRLSQICHEGNEKGKRPKKGEKERKGKERREKSIERRKEKMAEESRFATRHEFDSNSNWWRDGQLATVDRDTERGGRKMGWKFGGD